MAEGDWAMSIEHSHYECEPGWSDRCQVANSRFKLSIINTYTMLIEAINVGIIGIPFLCETFKGQCIFELYDTNIPAEGWYPFTRPSNMILACHYPRAERAGFRSILTLRRIFPAVVHFHADCHRTGIKLTHKKTSSNRWHRLVCRQVRSRNLTIQNIDEMALKGLFYITSWKNKWKRDCILDFTDILEVPAFPSAR